MTTKVELPTVRNLKARFKEGAIAGLVGGLGNGIGVRIGGPIGGIIGTSLAGATLKSDLDGKIVVINGFMDNIGAMVNTI